MLAQPCHLSVFSRQWCLSFWLCAFVAQRIVLGPPTASPVGHRCTVGVLAGTHRCALVPRVASKQSANPCVVVGVLSCQCLVRTPPHKFNEISPFSSSRVAALVLYEFRVPCLTTILDSRSLESEDTYTPARRVALFWEHFVAPTAAAGCGFWVLF